MKPYYQNESVTLYHGDCLEVMPDLTMTFDACITDPPYGTTACKWDSVIPFEPMWENLKRLVKSNGAICLFGSEPFSSMLRMSNLSGFRYDWVWEKSKASNFLLCRKMPLKAHEIISVFGFSSIVYYPQKKEGMPYSGEKRAGIHGSLTDVYQYVKNPCFRNGSSDGTRFPRSVQYFKTAESESTVDHPTQKPVALIEYLIKTYTNEGESVLDFASGSGTTGVACMNLQRKCVLIEMEERYCEITANRLQSTERELAERLF